MPTTVGSHSVAAFVNPSNGDALDATVVKGNDNTLRTAYVNHDADPGVHVQSSVIASRPAAGVAGRKWMTTDGGVKLWYDTGSVWEEVAYLNASSNLNADNLASGTVPNARFPATLPAANGSNLTNLNASALSSGTVPDARFPATLPVLNGSNLTNVVAAAGSLTGTTLASNVVTSSLTSVGTLGSLTVTGAITANSTVSIAGTTTLQQALEKVTVSATAATGTINFDALTQGVLYYTSNATGNWTLNVRGSSGTALSAVVSAGQALTIAFLVTNGSTAYYPTAHQIDGSSVTPKWALGTAPSAGNINAVDIYTYTIVRTSVGFEMFAARTYYA
jgi:hypothetical protein